MMGPHCLEMPVLDDACFHRNPTLPYQLKVEEVKNAMVDVYSILHQINTVLYGNLQQRLEDLVLGNSLSGIISELVVRSIGDRAANLVRNAKVGGHPDLLPVGVYDTDHVQHGDEGIEVKTSIQTGGWQGHNPEDSWIIVFRYVVDTTTEPNSQREPARFVQVLLAHLAKEDWSFSGRKGESRRTPTASITATGVHKLRSNPIYQEPNAVMKPELYSFEVLLSDRLF